MTEIKIDINQDAFSPRVAEAVEKLSAGYSYKEAARALDVDPETIKNYASTFRIAMEAKSTIEAVAKAVARGVISIREVDGKTLLSILLIGFSGFQSGDILAARVSRASRSRRDDESQIEAGAVSGFNTGGSDFGRIVSPAFRCGGATAHRYGYFPDQNTPAQIKTNPAISGAETPRRGSSLTEVK